MEFSKRMKNIKSSEIRELLKIIEDKQIISFAGGLPAEKLFPIEEIKDATNRVLDENGQKALQYSSTEGFIPLRKQISMRMKEKFQADFTFESIMIVSGSQQALDMIGKLFLDDEDIVVCENPTYLGAINAFNAYNCKYITMPTDDEGVIIQDLKVILDSNTKIKLVYVNPDFQNPTGRSWSFERRKDFMELMCKYDIPVIEDNPYGEVTFRDYIIPSLKFWDKKQQVIFLGTFSKILTPGLRIGWIASNEEIFRKLVLIKQSVDLHSPIFNQMIISKYIKMYNIEEHIGKIISEYKYKCNIAIKTMEKEFPVNIEFTKPEGGLFIWVTVPEYISVKEVLEECISDGVAFVNGESFFVNNEENNNFRFNFSNASEEDIVKGIEIIARIIRVKVE